MRFLNIRSIRANEVIRIFTHLQTKLMKIVIFVNVNEEEAGLYFRSIAMYLSSEICLEVNKYRHRPIIYFYDVDKQNGLTHLMHL